MSAVAKPLEGKALRAESGARKSGDAPKKTLEEQADFLREYVRLQLWFVWTWLSRHPEESFRHVLRERVDIFRKSDLNPGRSTNTPTQGALDDPRWLALEERACQVYAQNRHADANQFEQAAWEIFRPVVEARVDREFNAPDPLSEYQCGSLKYNPREGFLNHRVRAMLSTLRHGHPPVIFVHVGNRLAPNSFFTDRAYLPQCFFQFMEETRRKYHVGALCTDSWLNSLPRWLALFPREWQENLTPPSDEVDWSQSCWGQFITARGTFNAALGRTMRETGELPFKPRSSWCTFEAMRQHLHHYLEEGAS